MSTSLSDHFTYRKLISFTLPSILMMLFTSIYGIVDGYFVSNFVGKTEFAALNLIWPFSMVLGAVGFMFGTGGAALVSKTLGEGDREKADRYFSIIIWTAVVTGVVLAALGLFFVRPVAVLMGAEGKLLEDAVVYGRIIVVAVPTFILQCAFQPFMVTAERPKLGFWITFASGMTNIVFDILLVGVFRFGLVGAASASALSQVVGMVWPLIFFMGQNRSTLHLGRPDFRSDLRALLQSCSNGLSELVTNVALSLVGMVYNARLLALAGENGVAAYGVIMYVNMIFLSVFFGYSMGVSPLISYHFGAGDNDEVRNLRGRSIRLQGAAALFMTMSAMLLARPLAVLFVGYDAELLELTVHAFRLFATSYLLSYLNIFSSSYFTALNNGLVSATISFSRMLVFQVGSVLLLPFLLGLDGIWLSMTVAEILSLAVSLYFYYICKL